MKFGKNLMRVVELSDPEWGPFFMNYKYLKKRINDIIEETGGVKVTASASSNPAILSKSLKEVDFFHALKAELKKTSDFFATTEQLYRIRHARILDGYQRLVEDGKKYDKNTWSRLLRACVKFYKDVLLLENFAIMNYCGFSKILKKHDKLTGFTTREKFMRNVMSQQNFTHYPYVLELLKKSEQLYADIQGMESVMPLEDEERLFIDAIRDLNHQASCVQREENAGTCSNSDGSDADSHDDAKQYSEAKPSNQTSAGAGLDAAALAVIAAANKSIDQSTPDLKMVMSWIQAVKGVPHSTGQDCSLASEFSVDGTELQPPHPSAGSSSGFTLQWQPQPPTNTFAGSMFTGDSAREGGPSLEDIASSMTSPAQSDLSSVPPLRASVQAPDVGDEFCSYRRGEVFVATRKRLSPTQEDFLQNESVHVSKLSRIV